MYRCESEQFPKQQPKSNPEEPSGFKENSREATFYQLDEKNWIVNGLLSRGLLVLFGRVYYRILPTALSVSIFDELTRITGSRNSQPALKHSRRWSVCPREEAF